MISPVHLGAEHGGTLDEEERRGHGLRAMRAGRRLYTDSGSSYRAVQGYVHELVNHTQQEYACGEVHENRAECLFALLKPDLRVFRGSVNSPCQGTSGSFSSCGTSVNAMRSSRPN